MEKDMFFKRLPTLLPAIPDPVAQRKLLPLLARALEYGGAPASAVGSLLVIGKGMGQAGFLARVVPCLSKLFASSDRGLRRNLLESIDQYGPFLTTVGGCTAQAGGCSLIYHTAHEHAVHVMQ